MPVDRCDLCSKIIHRGDEISKISIRGKIYQFCCPTCAAVYSSKFGADLSGLSEPADEDPIEYVIPSKRSLIHQREIGIHTQSFSDGLRNCLRENPDVIVVGELRDLESISLAIRAAETGHLVFGTLHSGTAVQALTRVIDVFDGERQAQIRIQLAQSLQAVCAQRLFKRRDLQAMIAASEVLIATLAVRTIIRANRLSELYGYMEIGRYEQMHSFKQSIQALIDAGLVDSGALGGTEDSPIPRLPYPQKFLRRFGN